MNNHTQLKSFFQKHGPDILSGLASAGVVLTAYLTGRAAVKTTEETKYDICDKKTKTKKILKNYILPVLSGVGTIACIWGSRRISAKQLASMASVVGYLAANKSKMRANMTEEEVVQAEIESSKLPVSFEETGRGDTLCFEAFSGRWFKSSPEAVEMAIETLTKMYKDEFEKMGFSYAALNDLYDLLNMQTTYYGDQLGWCDQIHGGDLIFETEYMDLNNGLKNIYVIRPAWPCYPVENYMEF